MPWKCVDLVPVRCRFPVLKVENVAGLMRLHETQPSLVLLLQMYMFPRASLTARGLKAEALKEFVTVEYELVPPSTVPSPKSWLYSLLSLLFWPIKKFFSAFNHLEENGIVSDLHTLSLLTYTFCARYQTAAIIGMHAEAPDPCNCLGCYTTQGLLPAETVSNSHRHHNVAGPFDRWPSIFGLSSIQGPLQRHQA